MLDTWSEKILFYLLDFIDNILISYFKLSLDIWNFSKEKSALLNFMYSNSPRASYLKSGQIAMLSLALC